jgi:hypothetical protein
LPTEGRSLLSNDDLRSLNEDWRDMLGGGRGADAVRPALLHRDAFLLTVSISSNPQSITHDSPQPSTQPLLIQHHTTTTHIPSRKRWRSAEQESTGSRRERSTSEFVLDLLLLLLLLSLQPRLNRHSSKGYDSDRVQTSIMAVQFEGGVVIGADSRTTSGFVHLPLLPFLAFFDALEISWDRS